jgi:hypothetical protein
MAKSKLNSALSALSGAIDRWVYKQVRGRTVVYALPETTAAPTEAQLAARARFRRAADYANRMSGDPALFAPYEAIAKSRNIPVREVMMADYFRPPVIGGIDLAGFTGAVGDPIKIEATDDCAVMGVTVQIRAEDDTLLEEGAAAFETEQRQWVYATTVAYPRGTPVSITATAVDRPGNKGSKFATWS